MPDKAPDYWYASARPNPSHAYLWPVIKKVIRTGSVPGRRALDLGCGSGATAHMLHEHGLEVVAIDQSASGLRRAKEAYPEIAFSEGSVYDDLAAAYGRFDLVVSLEVIEHLLYPGRLCSTICDLLVPGGIGIVSTPYHGYWKNLAIAVSGRWDHHHNPLRDGGHVKFFSARTLTQALGNAGFTDIRLEAVGRIPPLAKSLIGIVRKPSLNT